MALRLASATAAGGRLGFFRLSRLVLSETKLFVGELERFEDKRVSVEFISLIALEKFRERMSGIKLGHSDAMQKANGKISSKRIVQWLCRLLGRF